MTARCTSGMKGKFLFPWAIRGHLVGRTDCMLSRQCKSQCKADVLTLLVLRGMVRLA